MAALRSLAMFLLLAASVGVSLPSRAEPASLTQEATLTEARESFRRGVALAQEGRFDESAGAFEASLRLVPHAATHYNLALTELSRQRPLAARRHLQTALTRAAQDASELTDELLRAAMSRRRELESQLVLISLALRGPGNLLIDGTPAENVDVASGNVQLWLEPGRHELVAVLEGVQHVVWLDEKAGARRSISLPRQEPPVATPHPSMARMPQVAPHPSRVAPALPAPTAKRSSPAQLPAFAVGTLGAISSVVFGILALSSQRDLDELCPDRASCPAGSDDERARLRRYALLTDISLATAALGVGVGVYVTLAPGSTNGGGAQAALNTSF